MIDGRWFMIKELFDTPQNAKIRLLSKLSLFPIFSSRVQIDKDTDRNTIQKTTISDVKLSVSISSDQQGFQIDWDTHRNTIQQAIISIWNCQFQYQIVSCNIKWSAAVLDWLGHTGTQFSKQQCQYKIVSFNIKLSAAISNDQQGFQIDWDTESKIPTVSGAADLQLSPGKSITWIIVNTVSGAADLQLSPGKSSDQ